MLKIWCFQLKHIIDRFDRHFNVAIIVLKKITRLKTIRCVQPNGLVVFVVCIRLMFLPFLSTFLDQNTIWTLRQNDEGKTAKKIKVGSDSVQRIRRVKFQSRQIKSFFVCIFSKVNQVHCPFPLKGDKCNSRQQKILK